MTSKWNMVGEMFRNVIDTTTMEQIIKSYKTWEIERYFCEYLRTNEESLKQWQIDTLDKLLNK